MRADVEGGNYRTVGTTPKHIVGLEKPYPTRPVANRSATGNGVPEALKGFREGSHWHDPP